MADNSGTNNTSIIAVLVIFLVVVAVGVFAFRGRIFSDGDGTDKVEINVTTPAKGTATP